MRSTVRHSSTGQYARFPALSSTVYSSGSYTVTVNEAWAYTNGAVIATQQWDYDACAPVRGTGPCPELKGWVDLIVFPA
jgi:hypothetical protein